MTDLAITEQAGVFFPGVQMKPSGLIIDSLTQSQWKECGKFLAYLHGATLFWIGDWANYGATQWGEKYDELIEATGYERGTLYNAASVCNAIEPSRRRETLSFAHHTEVAKLEPAVQSKWLAIAEKESLSSRELRASVKAGKIVRDAEATATKSIGFDSIERLPLDFNRIYSRTFKGADIGECTDKQRLATWIEATQPMVDANRKAKVRLAILDGSR